MIEGLLHWPVKNKGIIKLGRRIEDINQEFCLLDMSLANGPTHTVPNMHRARSLIRRIDNLMKKAYGLKPRAKFDKLVLKEYLDSLFTQKEYIQFFFTKKYNKEWGMRSFLNYAFLPEDKFLKNPEKNGAMAILETMMKNINYRVIAKREDLMKDITIYGISVNPSELEGLILEKLPRFRKMIAEYNLDMDFETQEQIENQELIEQKKEIEKAQERLKGFLGDSMNGIYDLIRTQHIKNNKLLLNKPINMTDELSALIYDLVFNENPYACYDGATKSIEANAERFYFFKDKKTGKIRFYSGDIDITLGHENYHRLQEYFSRFMPSGLRHFDGGYNITGRTITEGTATFLETLFFDWLDKNKRKFNLSKDDMKIASLYSNEHFSNRLIRLCHSLYHREVSSAEGKEDYDAHIRLAKTSRIPILADEDYLYDESLPETFYYAFYLFGERYVRDTMEKLEKRETRRLGTIRKTKNFLKRNEPHLIQGLLTGNWGWSTHQDFFLNHYWPKARKYCD